MINFKSESANKTQQNNAKILFGKTGLTVLKKLEEYSKEKQLDTSGIDALLEVLKTKDTPVLEKFASSKTGKTLVTNCKQLAKAKSFAAIMKNIKAIKPLKSFDKFNGNQKTLPNAKPKKSITVSRSVQSDLAALGYYYDKSIVNLKNSSPLVILNTKTKVQLSTVDQTFLNLDKSKLNLKLGPKELAAKLNSLPGVECEYYQKAPTRKSSTRTKNVPKSISLAGLKTRGPSFMQHTLQLKVSGRGFDLSDTETARIVYYIKRHDIGLTKTKDPLNNNSDKLYTLYGTEASLKSFAKQVLGYHILDLDSLKIKDTKGVSNPNEKPVDGYYVMGDIGKKLAAYFTKTEEDVDYTGRTIGPNAIDLGITTPNTKTRNRRLHNFKLTFTGKGYGVYIAKYQTRSKTFPSVLITAKSLKDLERKSIQHIKSELDKDGRP